MAEGGAWNALVATTGHNLRRLADMSGRETQIQFWPFTGLVYGLATLVSMMLTVIPLTEVFVKAMQQVGEAANRGGNAQPEFVKSPEMLAPDFSSLFWPIVLIDLVTVLLLAAAGNHAELAIYPGAVHGFTAFPYGLAEQANARIDAFLKQRIGG